MAILSYQSPPGSEGGEIPPPLWRGCAYRARHWILAGYSFLIALLILAGILLDFELAPAVICTSILFWMQGLFLMGAPQLRFPRSTHKVPMAVSLITGAMFSALLCFGVFAALLNIGKAWDKLTDSFGGHIFWIIALFWGIWILIFALALAGSWVARFRTMYRTLIAGTVLELLITIPIDAHVRRRTNCYCGEGTFFAMVIGVGTAFCGFGPGLALLFMTRRLQRQGYFALCRGCAFDLRGAESANCPNCGKLIPKRIRGM